MLNLPELSVCDECASPVQLDEFHAESVCTGCSLVVQERITESERPTRYDPDGAPFVPNGSGPAQSPYRRNLMTEVRGFRDARGKALNKVQVMHMFKLTKVQTMVRSRGRERSLGEIDGHITRLAQRLGLNHQLVERAAVLARQVKNGTGFRGQPFSILAGTVLLLSCREVGNPVAALDIASALGDAKLKNRILRLFRMYKSKLALNSIELLRPEQVVPRIVADLNVPNPNEVRALAVNLLRMANIKNKSPWTLAAGAIYGASRELGCPVTEKLVSRAAKCSEVSTRSAYRALLPFVPSLSKQSP